MAEERLESWKEIAVYLRRQVRTVQGWETREGLPVHRLQHAKLGSVFAYKTELDAWLVARAACVKRAAPADESPEPSGLPHSPRPRLQAFVYAGCSVAVVAAGLLGWRFARANGVSARPVPLAQRYFAAATGIHGHVRLLAAPAANLLAVSPDGRRLVAASWKGEVALLDPHSGAIFRQWRLAPPISSLVVSPDGRWAYLISGNSRLTEIDLHSARLRTLALEGSTAGLALSPDGRFLYVAFPYAGIDRLDTRTLARTHWNVSACPQSLAASPDGRRLFVGFQCGGPGGSDGHDAIGALDAATGVLLSHFAGPPRVGSPLAVSPDGNEIWSNSGACAAPQFDHRGCPFVPASLLQVFTGPGLRLQHTVAITTRAPQPQFGALAFLPFGERLLDGNYLLSSTRYARLEVLPSSFSNVSAAAVTRDGAHLYLAMVHQGRTTIADFTPNPAACTPPTQDLTDWWPGDGSADDAWGMVNARPSAAVTYEPGPVGQAFDLTQPGAYLTLGADGALDFRLHRFTLAAWVKFTSAGAAPVLTKARGWYMGRDAAGLFEFCPQGVNQPGCLRSRVTLASGVWHHIAVTGNDSGALALFVNAHAVAAAPAAPLQAASRLPVYAGADSARHQFLRGSLDELMLFRRALTPAELRQLARMPACLAAAPEP
ncbi:MAG: hypothetical protein EPN33_14440 [Acidobacteria bacterium]|nr:MAG: hypothetical protein EPN33_14440 [Acidobacteriota bacterium]